MNFPDFLANTDYELTIFSDKVSKTGGNVPVLHQRGKCIFVEKSQAVIDSDSKKITSTAYIIANGDIFGNILKFSNGEVIVNNQKYSVISCEKPRNPDGTVFSTEMYLR
ncbi:MAG: hypothetical protein NC213_10265 [Acetobacter sp.]|nr:hypothetical protein [Bacteroides sp.]MCM1342118.1 hypothetical protein [Acetobacter sp.]MCM1434337.1 hypothetical protein [Clostridiales bacterium]